MEYLTTNISFSSIQRITDNSLRVQCLLESITVYLMRVEGSRLGRLSRVTLLKTAYILGNVVKCLVVFCDYFF